MPDHIPFRRVIGRYKITEFKKLYEERERKRNMEKEEEDDDDEDDEQEEKENTQK